MFKYKGESCPYCKQPFSEGDDIVVCPDCGAPHHRECYSVIGHCAHQSEHGSYEWGPAAAEQTDPEPPDSLAEAEPVLCPRCGRQLEPGSKFCDYCGAELNPPERQIPEPAPIQPDIFGLGGAASFEKNLGDNLYGVPVSEWKTYIGQNSYYYLYHMSRQEKSGRPTTATLSAMLFPTIYFLYRRVWWMAGAAFLANLLFNIPGAVLTAQELGLGLWQPFGLTAAAWQTANTVTLVLSMAFSVVCGLFAVSLFRRSGARRINRLHDEYPDPDQFHEQLKKRGGPCRLALYIVCGVVTLAALATSMFGGAAMLFG